MFRAAIAGLVGIHLEVWTFHFCPLHVMRASHPRGAR